MKRDVVVLLSGGLDSAVLAFMAREQDRIAALLHFKYRQPAEQWEELAALRVARDVAPARFHVRRVTMFHGEMATPPGEPGLRVVPARNLVFLALGINFAEHVNADEVWYGATKEDQVYADCTRQFVDSLNETNVSRVIVAAPLMDMTKREVVEVGIDLGLNFYDTWSCYAPRAGVPCRQCDACRARDQALAAVVPMDCRCGVSS